MTPYLVTLNRLDSVVIHSKRILRHAMVLQNCLNSKSTPMLPPKNQLSICLKFVPLDFSEAPSVEVRSIFFSFPPSTTLFSSFLFIMSFPITVSSSFHHFPYPEFPTPSSI
ncbi:hypothetical protein K432DRAFT_121086 [Lepidopterella palustris CBS 459.81]|uniref:Uncharacterized protein n=1 Tax=Lepidopterella palustris CBS 459.81 TaxID=1314670 RepID=A0A8E2E4S7_9PEZI|nr:hypothetical protein K432DRAFT_121086 [Lepidopterella palustris CBS 459.81]